jgi:hypothetical protein
MIPEIRGEGDTPEIHPFPKMELAKPANKAPVGLIGILRLRLIFALSAQRPILAQDDSASEARDSETFDRRSLSAQIRVNPR